MTLTFPVQAGKSVAKLLVVMITLLTQAGCMQGQTFAATSDGDVPSTSVSNNTLKIVNGVFYTSLTRGNWYYKGARAFNGTINAYIEASGELGMSEVSLQKYLQVSICPGADRLMLWQQLHHITLNVHLYTDDHRDGVRTQCRNPLV